MVRMAGADRSDGDGDRRTLMPRKLRPGPKKQPGPKKGSRRHTLEWFAEFEDELESALQLRDTRQSKKPRPQQPLQKPTGQFCFLLPVLNATQKAQLLHDAEFTKRFGIQGAEHLRQLLAELCDVKRRDPIRFNVAKLNYLFEDRKN
jgi:hypothetical protein